MIEEYFGLLKHPFKLSADPNFYFESASHRRALAYLDYSVEQAEGIVLVTGGSGTGKTMLVHHLVEDFEGSDVLAVTLSAGQVTRDNLLEFILSAFGIEAEEQGVSAQNDALQAFLSDQVDQGYQPLLVVDEAQTLEDQVLQQLRLLTNMAYEGLPLLQIALVGEPELARRLKTPALKAVQERVVASCQLDGLEAGECEAYVNHRLECAGWDEEDPVFTIHAIETIYAHAGGNPRNVNRICGRALMQAAVDEADFVDRSVIEKVLADLKSEGLVFETDSTPLMVPKKPETKPEMTGDDVPTTPDLSDLVQAPEELKHEGSKVVPFQQRVTEVEPEIPNEDASEASNFNSAETNGGQTDTNERTGRSGETSSEEGAMFAYDTDEELRERATQIVGSVLDRLQRKTAVEPEFESAPVLEKPLKETEFDAPLKGASVKPAQPVSLEDVASEISAQLPQSLKEITALKDDLEGSGLKEITPPAPRVHDSVEMQELKKELRSFMDELDQGLEGLKTSLQSVDEQIDALIALRRRRRNLAEQHLRNAADILADIRKHS